MNYEVKLTSIFYPKQKKFINFINKGMKSSKAVVATLLRLDGPCIEKMYDNSRMLNPSGTNALATSGGGYWTVTLSEELDRLGGNFVHYFHLRIFSFAVG